GGLRIPLIVRWPSHVAGGKISDQPVINTDWIPTLLELAGLPPPSGLDGISFAPLLMGRGTAPSRSFFWHFPHFTNQGSRPSGAIRQENWMLVEYYDEDAAELYDLSKDIAERQNLASQFREQTAKMRVALASWRNQMNAQTNAPNPKFDLARFREL